MGTVLKLSGVCKAFTLHMQGSARINVFDHLDLELAAGDVLALTGPSGTGKSSLVKLIYGTYAAASGEILVRHRGGLVDMTAASPRQILEIRRETIGYVTQFLRVIPRVPCLDIVAEPLIERGMDQAAAAERARGLLTRLNIPETLWGLSPLTFSGGEQQRVNIARGFAAPYPVLLLDEPTASLDQSNRAVVLDMIAEAASAGAAIIGIFHNKADRDAVCSRAFGICRAEEAA